MQTHSWDDLRFLLALHRTGKLAQAARAVGVSETTVARRIKGFEESLKVDLFVQTASGHYIATDTGLSIVAHAEKVERENEAIRDIAGHTSKRVAGTVRISAVPMIVNRILVPHLAQFNRIYPDLTLELAAEPNNVDLGKREADLALRFGRPAFGGLKTTMQKLATLPFEIYGPNSIRADQQHTLGWVGYDEAHANLPQAKWLAAILAQQGMHAAPLNVSDAETALEAVACGLGRTILPECIARSDRRLIPMPVPAASKPPSRDLWLMSHVDHAARTSVASVKAWLIALFGAQS
jgi:DNA-binding transcriptional LysR family regulator